MAPRLKVDGASLTLSGQTARSATPVAALGGGFRKALRAAGPVTRRLSAQESGSLARLVASADGACPDFARAYAQLDGIGGLSATAIAGLDTGRRGTGAADRARRGGRHADPGLRRAGPQRRPGHRGHHPRRVARTRRDVQGRRGDRAARRPPDRRPRARRPRDRRGRLPLARRSRRRAGHHPAARDGDDERDGAAPGRVGDGGDRAGARGPRGTGGGRSGRPARPRGPRPGRRDAAGGCRAPARTGGVAAAGVPFGLANLSGVATAVGSTCPSTVRWPWERRAAAYGRS